MAQTATTNLPPLAEQSVQVDTRSGKPVLAFLQWILALDRILRAGQLGTLVNAANDTAAKNAGVPVNGIYRNGSAVQIRVT